MPVYQEGPALQPDLLNVLDKFVQNNNWSGLVWSGLASCMYVLPRQPSQAGLWDSSSSSSAVMIIKLTVSSDMSPHGKITPLMFML